MAPSIESIHGLNDGLATQLHLNQSPDSNKRNNVNGNDVNLNAVFDFDVESFILRNGLRNLGNTCFLNSAVQMLFSLDNGFIEDLLYPCGKYEKEDTEVGYVRNQIHIDQNEHQEVKNVQEKSLTSEEKCEEKYQESNYSQIFQCCGSELIFPSDFLSLCWPTYDNDNIDAQNSTELTQEEVEENAIKLHSALVQIGKQLIDSDTSRREVGIDPTPIKEAIDAKTKQFIGYRQHDSHEFFTTMLDMLSEEETEYTASDINTHDSPNQRLITQDSDSSSQQKKMSVVDRHFCSEIKVTLQCCACGLSRSRIEMYRHISLDINPDSSSSIDECIANFFQPEQREIRCEHCCNKTATESREFVKLPNALLLHLKRFVVDVAPNFMLKYQKNNERVEFMTELNLNAYLAKETATTLPQCGWDAAFCSNPFTYDDEHGILDEGSSSTKYKLKSVIHHIGANVNQGHYTADVLTKNKKSEIWMRCSDSVVTPCVDVENSILGRKSQKEAYMIMYEKARDWQF